MVLFWFGTFKMDCPKCKSKLTHSLYDEAGELFYFKCKKCNEKIGRIPKDYEVGGLEFFGV